MQGRKIEQISREEFYKLFGTARRQLRIQDVTGADTGVQYDFIPHVESEALPESATYTFFLRAEDPRIFLLDDLDLEENVRVSNIPEKKNKNSPRRPKVQLEFEESEQKTGSGIEAIKNTIEHVELTEEDRQSITSKSSAYPTANISNFFDELAEEEDSEEWSTLRPDLTSISLHTIQEDWDN